MKRYIVTLILLIGSFSVLFADSEYRISADSIFRHIEILASDSLEGREVGEPGEWAAAQYIISVLEDAGLEPRGDSGSYLQSFEFTKRIDYGPDNRMSVGTEELTIGVDFQPLPHSASKNWQFERLIDVGYGIITVDSSHNDYAGIDVEGKAVLIRRYAPEQPEEASDTAESDTTYDRYSSLTSKINTALDRKVSGIFFYTPESHDDTMMARGGAHVTPKDIPIVFLRRAALEKMNQGLVSPTLIDLAGQTDLVRIRDTGYNVIGYLPGTSDTVSIIGAHYDHLGWGTESSRYLGEEKKIHYGADDNGSGTAALLELARYFSSPSHRLKHSALFIAFSGEEAGTLGSGHFVRNWTVPKATTRLMVNMDMIGRLADQEKGLAIMGTGTCQEFKEYFENKDVGEMTVVFKESGAGPSDHNAFYHDSVPALHFFTGAHMDYHTPEDVVEKIDAEGIVTVTELVLDVVRNFDSLPGPLTFLRTKDEDSGNRRANMSVTLGIMPDFISELNGLGVDGVSLERPADRAGILKGDIIIKIGSRTVGDIYDYMGALEKYRKGDSCDVILVRGTDTLTLLVEFK